MGDRQKKSKKRSGTKAEPRLEDTTFFIDNCLGNHVFTTLRNAGWKVKNHLDHFKHNEDDEVWIPKVTQLRWVLLTKDKRISKRVSQRDVVVQCRAQMFSLPNGEMTGDEMAKRFLERGRVMGRTLHKYDAPFIARVCQNGIEMDLGEKRVMGEKDERSDQ
jgi:hypothetical protein